VFDDRPDSIKQYSGRERTYGLSRSLWLGNDGTLRIEVFANDRQAIARMIYPTLGGKRISLFSEKGNTEAKSLKK